MNLAIMGISFVLLLVIAYRSYGRFISRHLHLDDSQVTPAHTKCDGVDYLPTKPFYLFAQHFSAIAAAGPIAGPIMACMIWGWFPCVLWIALGVVLIGAVHDFVSLTISVRHGAVSIAEVVRGNFGDRAGLLFTAFIWIALIYVIVAFTDITAASFVGVTEELAATQVLFNPGGAVAASAIAYLALSLIMGIVCRFLHPPLWLTTVIFVPLAFLSVWLGTEISTVLLLDAKTWCILILLYCAVSSLLPVWLLLQPRGYLGGFILYSALAVGIVGIVFGNFEIKQEAFKTFDAGNVTGAIFPFLFVTIACGACSGFHGLVCSGTTSKQIDRESHMRAIGYGAMLAEALVAMIALVTVIIWTPEEIAGLKPGTIYGKGIGEFLAVMVGHDYLPIAITFGAMAFSTFVFDTLDVSTRLGRYLLQEITGIRGHAGAFVFTALTAGVPLILIVLSESGSYLQFWTLFGASNQLLAALTLLSVTVWLYQARRRIAFTLLPMLFVLVITSWAIAEIAWMNLRTANGFSIELINGLVSVLLLCLAITLVISALTKLMREGRTVTTPVVREQ